MTDKKVIIGVNVTPEERFQVHELAKFRGYEITSDYLRELIIADAKKHGFQLRFDVDRGGDRRKSVKGASTDEGDDSAESRTLALLAA